MTKVMALGNYDREGVFDRFEVTNLVVMFLSNAWYGSCVIEINTE